MARPKTYTKFRIPERFSSLNDLHNQGFALGSECEKLILEQPWMEIARLRGISNADLGRMTGLSRQSISMFSNIRCRPDILSALLICETLGISVEQGFRLTGSNAIYSPCRDNDVTLFINLRTLEVVKSTEKSDSDEFEQLFSKVFRKKVNADDNSPR